MIKTKKARNNQIYLLEYFTGRIAKPFHLERDKDILYWDFSGEVCETVNVQIEFLLNHIVKNIKNREERRNQYLLPLKFLLQYAEETKISDFLRMEKHYEQEYASQLMTQTRKLCGSPGKFIGFCRRELFLVEKEPAWQTNVWYVDGLNILLERQAKGSVIQSFSFLDIMISENRTAFQEYMKYLFCITGQSTGTIRIQHMYIRELLRYLEGKNMAVSNIDTQIVKKYFNHLDTQNQEPQSYNNKVHGILKFIDYLQAKDFCWHNETSWMKIPETERSIPISDVVYWVMPPMSV